MSKTTTIEVDIESKYMFVVATNIYLDMVLLECKPDIECFIFIEVQKW